MINKQKKPLVIYVAIETMYEAWSEHKLEIIVFVHGLWLS